MARFIFRQIDYRDLKTFLDDGEIRSKNHRFPQACHQTSYPTIVERRGQQQFYLPTGGVVNDYVPFYFCPITSFSYVINKGNVNVTSPSGFNLGRSNWQDRLFIIYNLDDIVDTDLIWCFSDYALNKTVPMPTVLNDINLLEGHIDWSLFDENPIAASIPEIGYKGCCKYFAQKSHPRYALRQSVRMAEFLIKGSVPISMACVIICPTSERLIEARHLVNKCMYNIPTLVKPECFER